MRSGNRSAGVRPAEPQTARAGGGLLSPGERALWFLHRLAPGSAAYNLAGALRIAHLDAAALRRAVLRLVDRHPALRTTFPADRGEPFRRVQGWLEPEIAEEDVGGLSCAVVRQRFEAEALRPFDPERGPLLRMRTFRCGGEGAALFVFHHLIADFWSLTVILRELGELYREEAGGAAAELLPPPPPYEQWVERQAIELVGARGDSLRSFWTERLAGPVPVLDLPADRPRPAEPGGAGVGSSGRLGVEMTARLQAIARERGATLFATALAGYQLLLHRMSGGEEIWVGVPAAGRGPARWARTVGYFVNPVVLRGTLRDGVTFRELLDRARAESEQALAHRDWPFPWLADELHPVRDAGRTPLFQAMLVLYRTRYPEEEPLALLALGEAGGRARLGGLEIETLALDRRGAQLDVSLTAAVVEGAMRFRLELDADRFDAATAARLADRLEALLEAAADRPADPVDDLPLLRAAERQALFLEWNDPRAAEAVHGSLDALVAAQAERTPHATALVAEGRRLTYRELVERADGLARTLCALGAGPEERVAICAGRSPELVIAILAILRAGAAYVPLDPAHPRERLAWTLRDSGAALLVTESPHLALFAEPPRTILLDAPQPVPLASRRLPAPDPARLAYVLYTSGSTGLPKGVALEHAGALALLRWAGRVFSDADLAGVVASTSIGFDLSVFELFLPLSRGGTVLLVPDALHAGEAAGVTLINTVPSAMTELVRLGAVPASVRVVCLAGERLPGSLAQAVHRAAPGCRVLNLYGPTEATTYSTWSTVEPDEEREPAIGWPVDGTRVHLLDRGLRPLPAGVVGELFLAGAGLARGYAGRPGLTAARFVPDPWSPGPGGRLYRTGDLGRRRPDGALEILGRIDHQVKLRGFRIEPAEIEAALTLHPAVREAAVEVRGEGAGDRRLVAWVVGDLDPAALRLHLAARLPAPMVPSRLVPLEALPLTPNGKVDRRALAARPLPEEGAGAGYAPPRNAVEDALVAVFTEVLGRGQVGVQDDFFALGGHSLLATRLLARVRMVFGVDLPLRTLFTAPTVALLGEAVAAARREGRAGDPPLVRVPRDGPLSLSFSQRRLWVLHQIAPGLTAYHIPAGLRLSGRLDVSALERAIGDIVRRHEALRTSFPVVDAEPVQSVAPHTGFRLAGADLSALPAGRREAEGERLGAAAARRPFDLERGPLLRLLLLRREPEEHTLILVVHHLVFDGWSTAVFLRELSALYTAFARGLPSPLPEPALQYADWAFWQREWLRGEVLERQLGWWRDRLASAPRVLDLPADFPHPPRETHAGAAVPVRLPGELAEEVRALGRGAGATLFMVLLAAFQAVLARLSGQETVSTGTHVAGRSRLESEDLIGFFVNTVAIRTDLDGDPSGRELIGRVREEVLGAFAHQDLPFEKLVEALNPARDLRRSPLFQVAFTLQNLPREDLLLPGLRAELLERSADTAQYELSLILAEDGPGVAGELRYNTALFAEATVRRLLRFWQTCLEGLVAGPDVPVSALSILRPAERRQILEAWSGRSDRTERTDTSTSGLRALPLPALFALQVDLAPEAVALVEGEVEITYRELDVRSARLARRLRAAGAGPDTPVAVLLERSAGMVTALLAILRAGAAYVPLDLGYPRERLAWMLEDSGARRIVTRGDLLAGAAGGLLAVPGLTVVRIDDPAEEDLAAETETPAVPILPDHLAYILYTSGTTGRPKGVAIPHRAVARLVIDPGYVELGPGETLLQLAPVPFDASTFEIWGALLNGARLAIFPPGPVSLHALAAALEGHRVTTAFLTAGLFHQMIDEAPEGLAGLRQLITGGDAVSVPHARLALERLPGCRLVNGYGPTEATTFALCQPVAPADVERPTLSLGRPIARTAVWLLDARLEPVPVGVPGEIYLEGDGLARGYWRQPDRTAERFVPHPFGDGERLYRTGDLARWQETGRVDFLGRIDRQVKVRGFRVEPAEIEVTLALHPAVAAAVVAPRSDGRGDRRLVAWVVPRGPGPSETELLAWCRDRLPPYLVPGAFVQVEVLPLDPNGKVDRGALPEPDLRSRHFVAPRTGDEERIARVWSELLGVAQVGVEDDFFELGGHSLLATRVIARLRAAFGVDLAIRTLFEHPTVEALAGEIGRLARGGPGSLPPPRPRPPGAAAPLSFAQRRLWVLHQLERDLIAYHIPAALHLRGRLEVAAFERALGEIVRRHEALRTSFPLVDGEPVQSVSACVDLRLLEVDLAGLPEGLRTAEAWRLRDSAAHRSFDLEHGPLLRLLRLRLGDGEHVLFLMVHHLVFDGWSIAVFLRELSALYAAFVAGLPSPLPEPRLQYADWAIWQHEWLRGAPLAEQIRWWRERLADAPGVLDLPTDFPPPPRESHAGAAVPVRLPEALAAAVRAFSRAPGGEDRPATPFMVLLTAFQALLARLAGQETVSTGTHVAGRDRLESEDLIGFFVNTLVIRTDLDGNPTGRELVGRVRESVLGAFAHQDLPFEKLVEELNPVRDLRRSPLFQVAFTLQNMPRESLHLPGLEVEILEVPPDTAHYDLSLTLRETPAGIAGGLQYRTALLAEPTVRRLARSYEILLRGLVAAPGAPLSELPLLDAAERHQLLAEWGTGEPARPYDLPVHALIWRWAEATPDAPAVLFEGSVALTWSDLRRRALQLARSLRDLGVIPGTVVGISLDRSPDLVVAVLGTLETGAAYLPLDPAYPQEYLAYVVKDSGISLVLSKDTPLPLPRPGEEPVRLDDPPLPLESWAYILYTSGSTGKPKGTPVSHRALLGYLDWVAEAPLAGLDGVLFLTSLNFDASLKQLFAPLLQGRPVRLLGDESARRPERLLGHLGDGGAPGERLALNCVPSLWRSVLDLLEAGPAPGRERVPSLARLLLGGEGFDRDLVDRTHRLLGGLEIWNLYGPTEATANASAARLAGGERLPPGIGRPIRGARLHVLDRFFHPLPAGATGELAIGGAGVAPGYWKRPEPTAERFVPDPFAAEPGARLFRTGDLARRRGDGSLELLGRVDRQLKIRGLRIEPGEVEAVLLSHPAVAECVVGSDPGAARLVAWIVPRSGTTPLAAELRRHLEERLPAPLVPSIFVFLGAMPRLPNGKVSHAGLPVPEAPGPRLEAAAPRSQSEEVLSWLWCEVLGVPRIGVHDDFFASGGHSLLATRLLARVRTVFGVDLPLRTLFTAPTVARLSEAIVAARRLDRHHEAVPVEPVPRDGPLLLSFAQERLWFIDQWIPRSPAYNIPAAVRLHGPLDVGSLGAALAEIVRRHETLRTTFAARGGRPVQVIQPGMEVPLPVIDLAAGGAAEGWRELAGEEARRGFDLRRGPLVRTTLLRLGGAEHVLVVNLHHAVADGWSMGVLIEELRALYAAFREGRSSPLPALPLQYVDYAAWQRRLVEREALAGDLAWWRSYLAGAPATLELPADRPRPLWSIHRGAVEPVALPAALTGRLHALARREELTLFMILLAAFELLLARLAGVEDLVVGTAMAQRTPEVEGLIGLFVNLLPLRGDLAGDPLFTDLLARTRRSTLEANDHQDVPFERLVAALEPVRDPGRHPLFQVALTLQNAPRPEAILHGLALEIEQLDTGTARFDLTLLFHEQDGVLRGALEHSADLFDAATVRRFLSSYASLLAGIVDDPARPVSLLPLVSEGERRQILEVWSRPPYPIDLADPADPADLARLFARQAARTPEAVAVVELATGEEITYRELDRRSALAAGRLRAAGAAPDSPVAVLLERSAGMVVALLGILRAGAGYVPLDLAYPRERLAWMLEDSGARLVVTRGDLAPGLAAQGLETVRIDDLPEGESRTPDAAVPPDSLAYIVYTSGSTGTPKGVAATHRGVARVVLDPGYAALGPEETILQVAPVPFDASTFEIWGALVNGGRLVIFPPGPVSLRELSRALLGNRVTTLFLTTGLFHQMIDEEPAGLAGLRQLITGGDVISVARVRRALEALPGCRLIHAYGPTETTTFATCHTVTAADTARPTLTLGRPIRQTTVWLLDERLEPVPPGVPGEMYLGGAGLARGYWRRPEQTGLRFVPHPFAAAPGERLYRTGDLARWLPDGTLDFLGRIDRQVKIRGFRVEPVEIEATLERHPGVVAAVVAARGDGRGHKRLVAWVVPATPDLAEAELLAWCRGHLPAFMVPGAFVLLEALPLDPNGKVDRKVLPDPDPGGRGSWVAPRTPVEEQVAAVWSEVLGVARVGAADDFFELGGHSLLATQIVARLERDLGVELGLRAFFDEPTVTGVALAITRRQMSREDPERIARLLAQVQDLTPEELARLLAEDGA